MKAKVIIENGEATIVLTAENQFEIDLIENVKDHKDKHHVSTNFDADYNYGTYRNHRIELSIKEERP